jgi:hypothetical protein
MTSIPGDWRPRGVALAALAVPLVLLAVFAGLWYVAGALAACLGAAVLRWQPWFRWGVGAAVPPLLALGGIAVAVPATLVDGALAAVAGLGFLLWMGSDDRTMATPTDRLAGLALPGFAATLALATSLAARGVPPSFGIAIAGGILLAVLVATASLIGRPIASPAVPPPS